MRAAGPADPFHRRNKEKLQTPPGRGSSLVNERQGLTTRAAQAFSECGIYCLDYVTYA